MKQETIIIEIRDMEGGQDAKLLCQDMADVYSRFCYKNNITIESMENRPGFVKL